MVNRTTDRDTAPAGERDDVQAETNCYWSVPLKSHTDDETNLTVRSAAHVQGSSGKVVQLGSVVLTNDHSYKEEDSSVSFLNHRRMGGPLCAPLTELNYQEDALSEPFSHHDDHRPASHSR